MRKVMVFLFVILTTTSVRADYCASNYSELETTLGTYKFSSEKLCREAYKLMNNCAKENLNNARISKKKARAIDCAQVFMTFISDRRSEVERVHDSY
jgi:hypothetical protein